MRLNTIAEAVIPRELKNLAKDYWELRNSIISKSRMAEPYLCIQISKAIQKYLENKGFAVRFVKDDTDFHFHLVVDEKYVVDGSDYQFDYDKPIGRFLPSRISEILTKNNIQTIGDVIGLIDYQRDHTRPLDWTDSGCGWNPNLDPADHQQSLDELRSLDLNAIKGRLLPIMLKIEPIEAWDRSYSSNQEYDETSNDF